MTLVAWSWLFLVLYIGLMLWFGWAWLEGEAPNPFSCSAMGILTSLSVTGLVSGVTEPLPAQHMEEVFRSE